MEQEDSTTTRARMAAAASGAVMAISAGITAYGIVDSSTPAAVGGGLAGLVAAVMMALAKSRAWAINTDAERRHLADARREAENEQTRYVALTVAAAAEHRRCLRDLEGDRAQLKAQTQAAAAAMEQRFEDQREQLIIESMETGIQLYLAGLLNAPEQTPGDVVPFRTRQRGERATAHPADQVPQAARDREVGRP
ncbi:hypothetical protein ACIPJK_23635 [Streptomyces roseus]|uniref:hypothetical protein n=1 Tax=Streptomyces roseus TaxID=66430 RepID=UPI0038159718